MKTYSAPDQRLIAAFKLAAALGRLEIPCGSKSGAMALRARAYALAKALRKDAESQPELQQPVEWATAVSMTVNDEGTLIIRRKDQEDGMLALAQVLEAAGQAPVDPQAEAVEAMRLRMQEKLAQPTADGNPGRRADDPPNKNPYYGKR